MGKDRPGNVDKISSPNVNQQERYRRLSVILFSIGAIIGMILIGGSIYADFESMLFDVTTVADDEIRPISCPILMSTEEVSEVSALIKNTSDYPLNSLVRAHISRGFITYIREEEERVKLDPQESQRLSWQVTSDDAAYGHLILVKVILLDGGDPKHKGACGIIVLNLPGELKGWQVYSVLLGISVVTLLVGFRLWWRYGRHYTGRRLEATRSYVGLTVVVLCGLLFSLLGLWEVAAVFFYVGVLMVGVIVPHFIFTH